MIYINAPIRNYELKNSTIRYVYSESDGVGKDSDRIPETIDEIGITSTCLFCGDDSHMVVYPDLVKDGDTYYPVMRIRRVTDK